MREPQRQHRGFIMLMALAILAIVGVAILALASAMSYDGKRTFENATRSQLDQMLLAGATDAREHLKRATPQAGESWDVELPNVLAEQNGSLRVVVASADDAKLTLNVSANVDQRSAEQTLCFNRDARGWKLASAEIPFTSQ
jgi:type II secretory pathway component PulK